MLRVLEWKTVQWTGHLYPPDLQIFEILIPDGMALGVRTMRSLGHEDGDPGMQLVLLQKGPERPHALLSAT